MIEIIFEGKDYTPNAGCACCMCSPRVQGAGDVTSAVYDRKGINVGLPSV